jgi:hypothetical protein
MYASSYSSTYEPDLMMGFALAEFCFLNSNDRVVLTFRCPIRPKLIRILKRRFQSGFVL